MKRIHKNKKHRYLRIVLILLAAVILLFAVLQLTGVTHFFEKARVITTHAQTGGQATKGQPLSSQPSTTSSTSVPSSTGTGSKGNGNTSGSGTSTTTPLQVPFGNFVSDHHPNLSGSPAPNLMQSVCNTTPGATCQIVFTNTATNITRSLPSETADKNGSAYWVWKLQSINLTQGIWHIEAIAKLGSQTKTASDSLNLEVQQ